MSVLPVERTPAFKAVVVLVVALAVAGLAAAALLARPAHADTTFTVDRTDDPLPTPDGACKSFDADDCSLREAIVQANTTAGNDTVVVPADTYTLTRIGAGENEGLTGDLDLTNVDGVEIQGAGAATTTIDAGGIDRVFEVASGTTTTISGVTVKGGNVASGGGGIYNDKGSLELNDSTIRANTSNPGDGGGILNDNGTTTLNNSTVGDLNRARSGGGILNKNGTLTLNNSDVSGNRAYSNDGEGGGILNDGIDGTLTLNDSTVSDNLANAGGTPIPGGGIVNRFGSTTLNRSTVSGNEAYSGGGVLNEFGSATLNNSTVGGNRARSGGGGINNNNGTLTMDLSIVSGNSSGEGGGGGIYSEHDNMSGSNKTTITNSTISGNNTSGTGGGIYNHNGLTAIQHSTVTNNAASAGMGSGVADSGDLPLTNTSTEVLSTIISDNFSTDVDFIGSEDNSFLSRGFNLIGDGNATTAFNKPSDRTSVANPRLGPLFANGGPTDTHALLVGSPAIDKGANTGCPATDQRGVNRPQGPRCDIGAYERPNSLPVARNDTYRGKEDKTLNVRPKGVLRNDTDSDGDALAARVVSRPKKGMLTLRPNGSFTYKPKRNFNGADRFVYEVRDGKGGADRATAAIRLRPVRG